MFQWWTVGQKIGRSLDADSTPIFVRMCKNFIEIVAEEICAQKFVQKSENCDKRKNVMAMSRLIPLACWFEWIV